MLSRREFAVGAALTLAAFTIPQSPTVRKLGPPSAAYDKPFTGIEGVRELKDGRLVVLDAHEKAIHVIDPRTHKAEKIGREGDGPGEYRLPLELFPLAGDSSVVRDMARFGKLLVITPSGEVDGFVSVIDSALSTHPFRPQEGDRDADD